MSDLISKSKLAILFWWSVISYIALFTIQTLCTAVIGAMTGKVWSNLTETDHFIIICTILAQWSTTMLAFLNSAINQIKKADSANTTTTAITTDTSVKVSSTEVAPVEVPPVEGQ